jgi:hypothetical protein
MALPNRMSLRPGLLWLILNLALIIQCLSWNIFIFFYFTYPLRCLHVPPGVRVCNLGVYCVVWCFKYIVIFSVCFLFLGPETSASHCTFDVTYLLTAHTLSSFKTFRAICVACTPLKPSYDINMVFYSIFIRDKWVAVTTTWRLLRLRMEERPPNVEGSC